MTITKFFAIQNHEGYWYSEFGVSKIWPWQRNPDYAIIYTREECARYKAECLASDYPSKPIPKLVEFECCKINYKNIKRKEKDKEKEVGKCKFCGIVGFKSDQGDSYDGTHKWDVYAVHNDDCVVKSKGILQGEVTWVPLSDWDNFYKE